MINDKFFTKLDDLLLDIFVVGYPDKGESQIIILKDDKHTFFSCVIDCYRHKSINKTFEILNSNGIKRLDMFIWTHTDEDHSLDIENLVNNFCDSKTSFVLPELTYGNLNDFIDYSAEIKKSFDLINSFNTGQNYNVASATAVPKSHSNIWRNEFIDTETTSKLLFEIIAVAPCSALLRRRYDSGDLKKKNDLSIATIFKVGELNLFLSGDIEDQSINQMANYHFENIKYIKTPHHSSTTSTKLIDRLSENSDAKTLKSVSTIYKKHNLPHPDVVERYKKISDSFISTGDGPEDSGVDFTRFNVIKNEIINEQYTGNCLKIF